MTWCLNLLTCLMSTLLLIMSEKFGDFIFITKNVYSVTKKFILYKRLTCVQNRLSLLLVPGGLAGCDPLGPLPQPPLPLVLHHPQSVVLPQTVVHLHQSEVSNMIRSASEIVNLVLNVRAAPAPGPVFVMTNLCLE